MARPYDLGMAYDEELADRIREVIGDRPRVSEQKMFGGLAFLVGGHMAVAASREDGLLVRVDAAQGEKLIASGAALPMEMRGREMRGWLRVAAEGLRTRRQLARWVELGIAQAVSLPPKPAKRRSRTAPMSSGTRPRR